MVSEISNATVEQSKAINEISQSIEHMEQVVQVNTQSSDECAKTAVKLSDEAIVLDSSLKELLMVVYGEKRCLSSPEQSNSYLLPKQSQPKAA
jgi:methyl-accepting chemotaxis protein